MKLGRVLLIFSMCLSAATLSVADDGNTQTNTQSVDQSIYQQSESLPEGLIHNLMKLGYLFELARLSELSQIDISAQGLESATEKVVSNYIKNGLLALSIDKGTIGRHAFSLALIQQGAPLVVNISDNDTEVEKRAFIEKALSEDTHYQGLLNQTVQYWVGFFDIDVKDNVRILAAKNALHQKVVDVLSESNKQFSWNPIHILTNIKLENDEKWISSEKEVSIQKSSYWFGIRDKGTIGRILFKQSPNLPGSAELVLVTQASYQTDAEVARLRSLIDGVKSIAGLESLSQALRDQLTVAADSAELILTSPEKETTK